MKRDDSSEFIALTSAEALASGLTHSQLYEGNTYRRVARNLWVPPDQADGVWERCRALRLILPDDAVFSHYTAAALHRVVVPDDPLIHVCTQQPVEPRIGNVVGHRILTFRETDVQYVYGLPVTTPARTYVDLAARLDLLSLVIAGDGLARLDPKGVEGIELVVGEGIGRRGVRLARAGLALIDPASKSPAETRLRFLVVAQGGLPKPVLNAPVCDEAGEWIAEIDIQWPTILFCLEYEGERHREQRQFEMDIRRDENVRYNDWLVLKVTRSDLFHRPAATLARIKEGYDRQLRLHRRRR
jgi:hypothetical protein